VLGGWGVDVRDPTLDRRLVEFCLSIPLEEYLRGGVPRSLIRRAMFGRLPTAILQERRKGYQAADWHIGMTAGRETLAGEIERLAKLDVACKTLDIARMQRLVREWPAGSWSSNAVTAEYRLALLRGTSAGHFLRKATGANT
jgi:asparagine synthase (glutamine-hydrolysing)